MLCSVKSWPTIIIVGHGEIYLLGIGRFAEDQKIWTVKCSDAEILSKIIWPN